MKPVLRVLLILVLLKYFAGFSVAAAVPALRHGDVISLKTLAASTGKVWLDCNTIIGQVGLAENDDFARYSGTHWRVHNNQDGSFSLECLGIVPGRRWLRIEGSTPNLGSGIDRNEAARWSFEGDVELSVAVRNTSRELSPAWLKGLPGTGGIGLSETIFPTDPSDFWQVVIHSRANPGREGQWSEVWPLPESAIHTHVLPNGKVLFWSRYYDPTDVKSTVEAVPIGGASTFMFDPESMAVHTLPNAMMDAFCSGHSFLPDGRLLVTGGHVMSNVGPKSTQIFDYRTLSWEHSEAWDMNRGRWYPTNLTLGTGEVLTISGNASGLQDVNRVPQVWKTTGGWRDLFQLETMCFNDPPAPCMPLYPWVHMAPNGRAFVSGPGQITGYIDTQGHGHWEPIARTAQGWRGDYEATSTMYAPGKIMIAGGLPSTPSVEVIDLNAPHPQWETVAPMKYPRHKLTSTLLADGTVLVAGGTSHDSNLDDYSAYAVEIWNPETRTWTEGDHLSVPRLYHSTAVLLQDGRVLSMGGGLGAEYTTHKSMQIYSPPYLFRGKRPQAYVTTPVLRYGETLTVLTPDAAHIRKMHLIKLSSDTHSFNSNQLILPLEFTATPNRLQAVIPQSPSLAPPGHYWLFIIDEQGVPAKGEGVQLLIP